MTTAAIAAAATTRVVVMGTGITTTTRAAGQAKRASPRGRHPAGAFTCVPTRCRAGVSHRPMRRTYALLAALTLFATGPATAEPRLVFGSRSGVAEIPFQLYGNHIYVRGRVGDSDSLWIVLDTGASAASISASKAAALGLEVERGGNASGAGGVV